MASAVFAQDATAQPNYHLVGWINTVVPGAGELMLGNPELAGAKAGIETGTFLWVYSLSAHAPMTLDGVPEILPSLQNSDQDLSRSLYADMLQEAGLKYHMVNVYNAYRNSAAVHLAV